MISSKKEKKLSEADAPAIKSRQHKTECRFLAMTAPLLRFSSGKLRAAIRRFL
jgi:hypothetical protein